MILLCEHLSCWWRPHHPQTDKWLTSPDPFASWIRTRSPLVPPLAGSHNLTLPSLTLTNAPAFFCLLSFCVTNPAVTLLNRKCIQYLVTNCEFKLCGWWLTESCLPLGGVLYSSCMHMLLHTRWSCSSRVCSLPSKPLAHAELQMACWRIPIGALRGLRISGLIRFIRAADSRLNAC